MHKKRKQIFKCYILYNIYIINHLTFDDITYRNTYEGLTTIVDQDHLKIGERVHLEDV